MLIFHFGALSVAIGDPRFQPGTLIVGPGVTRLEQQGRLFTALYLRRHLNGDWGDIACTDRWVNEKSLQCGGRLWSVYHIASDIDLHIITEADRRFTKCRLADEADL